MRAYSIDLRERVLADRDEAMGTIAAAAKHRVSPARVRRLKQRRKATGEVAPVRHPTARRPGPREPRRCGRPSPPPWSGCAIGSPRRSRSIVSPGALPAGVGRQR